MKIPESFISIVTKLHPEIKGITLIEVITHMLPLDMEDYFKSIPAIETFTINIDIEMNDTLTIQGGAEVYTELINTSFKYVHTDMDFVYFKVRRLIFPPKLTNRERFINLFGN